MLILKIILLPLATWRLYRLFAREAGYKKIFKRLRIKLGVKYNGDFSSWETEEGSWAQMVVCVKCSTIWIGGFLTLLLLFAPDWLYLLVVLPFDASALVIIFENLVYSPREYAQKKKEEHYPEPKNPFKPCF